MDLSGRNLKILSGQVAIVTGVSRGIGRAIALRLLSYGAKVLGTATSEKSAADTTAYMRSKYNDGRCTVLDVNDIGGCINTVETAQKEFGGLSILVNNAGITRDQLAVRMKDVEWDDVIATNLTAVARLSRTALRIMIKNRYGRIINITSVVASTGNPGQINYAAAKAGISGMSRALAHEVGSRGITVNCVAPGFIDTDMTRVLNEDQRSLLLKKIPMGRLGSAEEVADAVVFLASPNSGYITGSTIHVNGGMHMT
jgi:3-oxoacyl-[acyl-carrier protein] reductase